MGNFARNMRELGAVAVRVGHIFVDFRRPVPWPTAAANTVTTAPARERDSAAGDVDVHDPNDDPDPFETWLNAPPMPTFKA